MPTSKELLRFLTRQGYKRMRQTGSHLILSHPVRALLVIPMHSRDLPTGLFLKILKDAGFTRKDFYGE
ncbi:MAG TPA: type II toxin-antitoxin system HicA family toxin [Candidatus Acidoferrales bacterium]|nr:type II toxin-antitoxin system HicA family toxin [Candidatus Acidoferrales bacterium]